MFALVSIGLAVYEAYACLFGKPKVTDLSHRTPWSFFIWGWIFALAAHFMFAAQRDRFSR